MLTHCDLTQTIFVIGTEIYAYELATMIRQDSKGPVICISKEQFKTLSAGSQCMLGFKNMTYRKDFFNQEEIHRHTWPTFVHESAVIIDQSRYWPTGTVVGPLSMIGHRAELSEFCDVGPMCLIGHGVRLGTNTVASNSVHIGGSTTIGKNVYLGQMSSIKTKVSITDDCFVAMNAVVTKDLKQSGTYMGSPARKTKSLDS